LATQTQGVFLIDWREFDHNPVSHSAAHHLTSIQQLLEEQGYARVSDVARKLGITRGSVSVTLKGLRQRGLVVEDDHKHLGLSEEGLRIARGIHTKRILFQSFLSEHLGLPLNLAEQDACKVEHLVSDVTAEALALFLESRSVESKEREAQVHSLEGRIKDGSVDIFPSDRVQTLSSELEKNSSSTHKDNEDE
jgi:Mn-dependent DtxR family transcriptional regulator